MLLNLFTASVVLKHRQLVVHKPQSCVVSALCAAGLMLGATSSLQVHDSLGCWPGISGHSAVLSHRALRIA